MKTFISEKSFRRNRIKVYSLFDLKSKIKSIKDSKLSYCSSIKETVIYSYDITRNEYKSLKDIGIKELNLSFNDYFGFK